MRIKVRENQAEEIEGLTTEYPYAYHHADLADTKVPWHWHEELEFDYIVSGAVKLTTTNQSCVFQRGEGFFINTNVLCTMAPLEESQAAVMDSHLFHPTFLGGHFKSIFSTKYLEPVLQNRNLEFLKLQGETPRQRKLLELLRQAALLQKREHTEFQTRNTFSDIWLLLLDELQETKVPSGSLNSARQDRIQTMIAFIQQSFQEKLSLEDIARSASISKSECLRCFRSSIHRTPFEYLLDYRIETAERLLRSTNDPILDIALQTGFSTGAYFGKMFRESCGMSPGAYRKLHRQPSSSSS
ncbi:AraC family transcriptional regulator [bacterium 1XD21-13]|nr:AraC family transcriptional regulator [bacterium 1XD21-13]